MFKAFISALLLVSVSAQSFAGTDLKAVFNEFNYLMTVEWDQTDSVFRAERIKELERAIQTVPQEELISFVKSEYKIDLSDHSFEALLSVLRKLEAQGASWSGGGSAGAIIGVVAVALAIVIGVVLGTQLSEAGAKSCWYFEGAFICDYN